MEASKCLDKFLSRPLPECLMLYNGENVAPGSVSAGSRSCRWITILVWVPLGSRHLSLPIHVNNPFYAPFNAFNSGLLNRLISYQNCIFITSLMNIILVSMIAIVIIQNNWDSVLHYLSTLNGLQLNLIYINILRLSHCHYLWINRFLIIHLKLK